MCQISSGTIDTKTGEIISSMVDGRWLSKEEIEYKNKSLNEMIKK